MIRAVMLGIVLLWCAACQQKPATSTQTNGDAQTDLRIVSLSPAISRTLVDFGLEKDIVGRTPYCASIDQSIPVVGSLLDVDYERLIKLHPTHILVQPSLAQGVEPKLRDLAKSNGWVIGEFPSLNSVDDIEAMILKLPALLFADGTDARQKASTRAAELTAEMARALTPDANNTFHGTTLLVAGISPVLVFGTETYLGDVLTALGGVNAMQTTGWTELSLEDVVRINPEAIVLVRDTPVEGGDVMKAAGPLATLPIRAARDGRIAALVHPDVNLPSSGVIGVAAAMREVMESLAQAQPAGAAP